GERREAVAQGAVDGSGKEGDGDEQQCVRVKRHAGTPVGGAPIYSRGTRLRKSTIGPDRAQPPRRRLDVGPPRAERLVRQAVQSDEQFAALQPLLEVRDVEADLAEVTLRHLAKVDAPPG